MIKAGNKTYKTSSDLPEVVPVFPLSGALLLPGGQMPLNIFEPQYVEMIDDALASDKIVGMIQPCLRPENAGKQPAPLSKVGCLGRITAIQETGDERYLLSLTGVFRYKLIKEVASNRSYRTCKVELFTYDFGGQQCDKNEIDRHRLLNAFRTYLSSNGVEADWDAIENTDNETLLTALCMMGSYCPAEKQALLEAPDLKARTETLIAISEMHLARQSGNDNTALQ